MFPRLLDRLSKHVHLVFAVFALFVVGSFALLIAIDIYNIGGLRETIAGHREVPFLWHDYYVTPFEQPIQWTILGLVVVVFGANAVVAQRIADNSGRTMWWLLTVGTLLMLLEDSLDIRHSLRTSIHRFTGEDSYGVASTLLELGYFAVLAAVLVFAFIRYRRYIWKFIHLRWYLIAGYVLYAIAVGSSWLGSAFRDLQPGGERDLYTFVGNHLTDRLFSLDQQAHQMFFDASQRLEEQELYPLAFAFMDRVWEESIETLGAAALLCAGLACWAHYRRQSDVTGSSTDSPADQ